MAFQKAKITRLQKETIGGLLSVVAVEFDVYDTGGQKQRHNAIQLGKEFLKTLSGTKQEQKAQIKAKLRECALIAHGNMMKTQAPPVPEKETTEEVDPNVEFGSDEIV